MRRWRDQRKADRFRLGRGIFRRINAASPSASAPLRPPPSLHLCGSQLEYASQSENSTFEPSQSTFEQAPTDSARLGPGTGAQHGTSMKLASGGIME